MTKKLSLFLFLSYSIFLTTLPFPKLLSGQYLSHLNCTCNDAVFTTYAAPMQRSDYRLDQGYQLMWTDQQRNIEFVSQDGGNLGAAFVIDGVICNRLNQFYKAPIITASYPDLVKFYFYPFKYIRVEVFFNVYSSTQCFVDYKITYQGKDDSYLDILPYFYGGKMTDITIIEDGFIFGHQKKRDAWMKNHDIPITEELKSVFMVDSATEKYGTYNEFPEKDSLLYHNLNHQVIEESKYLIMLKQLKFKSGETKTIRVMRALNAKKYPAAELLYATKQLAQIEPEDLIRNNEQLFQKIPKIKIENPDHEAVYWNSFKLIRQCMMEAEGESHFNYYIFRIISFNNFFST